MWSIFSPGTKWDPEKNSPEKKETRVMDKKQVYTAPKLVTLGSIGQLTQTENIGSGGLGIGLDKPKHGNYGNHYGQLKH